MISMHIHLHNQAFENFVQSGSEQDHQELKEIRSNLQRAKRRAKCKWQEKYMNNINQKIFQESPKEAWQMIFKLRDGFQTHHRDYNSLLFKNSEGKVATDKKESTDNIENHYNKVFNREAQIVQSILKHQTNAQQRKE